MVKKIHIGPKGPDRCGATQGKCPYKKHFSNMSQALTYYEFSEKIEAMRDKVRSVLKKATLVGTAVVATFNVSACSNIESLGYNESNDPIISTQDIRDKADDIRDSAVDSGRQAKEKLDEYDISGKWSDFSEKHDLSGKWNRTKDELSEWGVPTTKEQWDSWWSGHGATGEAQKHASSDRSAEEVLADLDSLKVAGHDSGANYSRENFLSNAAWEDTRQHVYARDFVDIEYREGGVVDYGVLPYDPYTGESLTYERGASYNIDVDHVVSLKNAWQTGAQDMTAEDRFFLATDMDNLIAVSSSENKSKSDKDADRKSVV